MNYRGDFANPMADARSFLLQRARRTPPGPARGVLPATRSEVGPETPYGRAGIPLRRKEFAGPLYSLTATETRFLWN